LPNQLWLVIPAKAGIQGFIATYPQPLDSRQQQQQRIPFFVATFSDRHTRQRGSSGLHRVHTCNWSFRYNGNDVSILPRDSFQIVIPANAGSALLRRSRMSSDFRGVAS